MATNEEATIVPYETLMRPAAFRRGVEEVRTGVAPNFDAPDIEDFWAYERGRQWALIAPCSMSLYVGSRINPKAIALFERAYQRGWITNEIAHEDEQTQPQDH
jgi:hypothetical protein